jgi:hypothetical protein
MSIKKEVYMDITDIKQAMKTEEDNNDENLESNIKLSGLETVDSARGKLLDNIVKTQKLSGKKWKFIEKPLSESDKMRNKIICELGEKNASTYKASSNLITIGEYNYLKLRDSISKYIVLPSVTKTEDKKSKINKKTQIILENCQNTLKNKVEILINILKNNPQEKMYEDLLINFNYVEMRLIILMKIIENYTDIKSASSIRNKIPLKFQKKNEIQSKSSPEKEEVLLAGKKILHLLKKIRVEKTEFNDYFNKIFSVEGIEIELCEQLIKDLEYKITCLSNECGTKLYEIANRRPKLIFDTKYDMTIPQMSLKPYDSQIELMNNIKNNINNGALILYKTLPGLGKTTMILGICKYIKKSDLNVKVIFCCSDILESVRVQVLRTIYNFGVKFGIGSGSISSTHTNYRIINSWNCPKDEERELIVADYITTYLILKDKKHDYLLFFDEPTVNTDTETNNLTLEYLSKILYHMPKYTILSSATLPLLNEMSEIISNYKSNYPDGAISEIVSNKTLTGCVIKDFNNNVISPHSMCNSPQELRELIQKIKQFPLLGKFYTLPFLMNLNEFMKIHKENIDLESIESFDQANILENILLLLERVCKLDEKYFEEFKNIEIRDIVEEQFDKSRLDVKYDQVVTDKLLTTHAYKYIGCCLIATDDPIEYAKKNLYSVVGKLKEKVKITNINSDYEKYKRDLKKFEEQIDQINQKFNQDSKIDEEIEKIMHKKPEFKFPSMLEINTHEHIETFAKYIKCYDKSILKVPISYDRIDLTEYDIDEELKFLLFMGVGLHSKKLDPDYCNLVLEMLSDRQLAYVIADESFCYGANYQISTVIINDDIGNSHSINTILQLIGRTSRVGKSWAGKVYLDTNTCTRITKFFNDPSNNSNEGKNISKSFSNIIDVIKKENKIEEEKELEETMRLQKKQEEMLLAKEKEEQEKLLMIERKKENINAEKEEWKELRRGARQPKEKTNNMEGNGFKQEQKYEQVNEDSVSNNTYKLPKRNVSDDDWSGLRTKREPITNTESDRIYRPGALRKNVSGASEPTMANNLPNTNIETNTEFERSKMPRSRRVNQSNPMTQATEPKQVRVVSQEKNNKVKSSQVSKPEITKINNNFRQDKEDELYKLLNRKRK